MAKVATALAIMITTSALAQVQPEPDPQPVQPALPGRTAETVAGQIGQRQTRERVTEELNVEPIERIANRLQNRVENRLRNRIDRDYNPRAKATSPFEAVDEQQRRTSRTPRR